MLYARAFAGAEGTLGSAGDLVAGTSFRERYLGVGNASGLVAGEMGRFTDLQLIDSPQFFMRTGDKIAGAPKCAFVRIKRRPEAMVRGRGR